MPPDFRWSLSGNQAAQQLPRYYRGHPRRVQTAVPIPDHVFERAESVAQRLGMSRSELYATALRAYLEHHDAAAQHQALDELYASESSDLPPGAHRAQARIVSEWDE